ncbi:ATP-binding protein [Persephonella sp. KM09-Lau-8]|uniref:ATP-binding protein n=1 Tax=Persephonella sp. KM09-Lau-8 TaxID=1158345 RepID=UPI0009DCF2C4|nr:ATP-binding protein [Persephonella sp. KM09-Lau-8]
MKLLENILANNKDKRIIIMPIGISGSGKTTLCKQLSKKFDIEHISFDTLRMEIFKKETGKNPDNYHQVYRYINENKIKLLPLAKRKLLNTDKKIVYIDNTNLKKKSRNKFLCVAQDYLKIAVFFKPDLKECIKRQFKENRDKIVSTKVILQQFEMIEPPDFEEFDIIIRKGFQWKSLQSLQEFQKDLGKPFQKNFKNMDTK